MSASIPAPTAAPDHAALDDDGFQQALRILLDAGIQLVQDLVADPQTPPVAKAEPYERLARSIRRTIALARHIAESPTKTVASTADRRTQSRRQVIRDVEDLIQTRTERPEQAESLRDELNERLDDPQFDHDLATRPIIDIIRELRRDLGIGGDTQARHRRTPTDIRDLNARAAAPPLPGPTPAPARPEFDAYEPGQTRTNPLLTRYRADDG